MIGFATVCFRLMVLWGVLVYPIKLAWDWTIPSIAPGAVAQGIVVGELSMLSAIKLSAIIAVIGGIYRAFRTLDDLTLGQILDPDPKKPVWPAASRATPQQPGPN